MYVRMLRDLCPHLEVAVADGAVAAWAAHVWAQGGAVYRSLEPVGGVVLVTTILSQHITYHYYDYTMNMCVSFV